MSPIREKYLQSLVLVVASVAPVSMAWAADSVVLKPKMDKPTEAYVEFDTDVVQTMVGPDGKPMEMKVRAVYGLLQKTMSKGDTMRIEATLDRILGFMAFGETMQTRYDTDEPDYENASPMHRSTFEPILNMPLQITLDSKGLAKSVAGAKAIREKLKGMGDQNFVAKTLAEGDFLDRVVMSGFGEGPLVLYPFRKVKVGETWNNTRHDIYPQVGKVIVKYDCKLDRIEKSSGREMAIVTFSGSTTKDPDEKPAEGRRLGKIEESFKGSGRFDVQRGRFVEIVRESTAKVEVPPWFTQEPTAPLMKIDSDAKSRFTTTPKAERLKRKADVARRVADASAKREAEEASAMAGPVDPVTPENAPVPWLQWGGPDRNFCSGATGLANRWAKGGPPKLWERQLGDGFSAILSDGDTVYTMYSIRDKEDALKGHEVVVALDAKTGKTRWESKYEAPWPKDLQMEFGPGPHSTPIIVGDRLFSVGCTASLRCLDKKTGSVIWSKDLREEYKAALLDRGYGSSPLAYKGNILLPVSREKGHAIMAFSQSDGSVAWKGGEFSPGYASLMVIEVDGTEQLVAFTGTAVVGLDPANGKGTWQVEHPTQWGAEHFYTCLEREDGHLFISSAYGMGSRGIKLEKDGGQITAKEQWFNPKMKIHHGDAVRAGEWVFGSSGDFGPSFLTCVNAQTGEFGWRQRGIAKANVLLADGKLIILDEDGALYLVKADPGKYRLLAKVPGVCKKTAWTVPTLVGRTLYLRDREKIMALDLGAPKSST